MSQFSRPVAERRSLYGVLFDLHKGFAQRWIEQSAHEVPHVSMTTP